MDPKTGFADITDKEKQVIISYSDVEMFFVASKYFYQNTENAFFRKHAVAIISMLAKRIDNDTLIPYLAMNYFDRFFSKNSSMLEDVEGFIDIIKVRLIAIACLTIAAKMRIKDFSIEQFLITYYRIVNVRISHHMVMRTELLILRELDWEIQSVTPFTFLNFYYRYFKKYGGFKRRCINEIIVQAQGEHTFVDYYPTVIAISAFLTASQIAYPDQYGEIIVPFTLTKVLSMLLQYKVVLCVDAMVDLCNKLNIQIETPESGISSTSELKESQQNKKSGIPSTSELQEIQQNKESGISSTSELQESQQNKESGIPSTSELQESQQNKESGIPSTSELQESQQNKESGIPSTSELKEIQQDRGKTKMVVDSNEQEDDDEEVGSPIMWRFLNMKWKSRALKISERVKEENKKLDKGETSGGDDKARIEVIIPQPLEKGEKMEGYISETAELEELKSLMNFELKWPEEVPSTAELETQLQTQTVNRSKSKGRILRTAKKLAHGDCKVG
ncbi:unnamed protein product [Vicia faba]|uniref:B-like cyclin n=1 Tax=Vicia faba TaxID=3906 RepID=A0AAV0Z3C5_VICFA|nr:unnamed protein product [Vicia faba]